MSYTCKYYICYSGAVYLIPITGWKKARAAAKRLHRNAFIMDVDWYSKCYSEEAKSYLKKRFPLKVVRRRPH